MLLPLMTHVAFNYYTTVGVIVVFPCITMSTEESIGDVAFFSPVDCWCQNPHLILNDSMMKN